MRVDRSISVRKVPLVLPSHSNFKMRELNGAGREIGGLGGKS